MSATGLTVGAERVAAPVRARRTDWRRIVLLLVGLLLVLAFVQQVTDNFNLTSSGQFSATLALAVPIGLAALGGLWSERAGVVNIGLEGQMILGTWFGAWGAFEVGPWFGVVAGLVGGAIGGLLHAIATVTFNVDHIVSGVAINILAPGLTKYLSTLIFTGRGGGATQSPPLPRLATVPSPSALTDWLRGIERHHWFGISDLAGLTRGLFTDLSWFTVLAVLLVPLTFWLLWRTAFGLRLRSCGEHPVAAESLGVNVYRYKYTAVIVSGGLAGLGGAFLSIVSSGIYRDGQTGGRGFIGLAAMIFGNWRAGGLAGGAGLFGYADALQLRGGGTAVHALLLALALGLLLLAGWWVYRRRVRAAIPTAVIAALVYLLFLGSDTVPQQFQSFTPHLTTLLVLALASQRLRMPAADGKPYRRGEE